MAKNKRILFYLIYLALIMAGIPMVVEFFSGILVSRRIAMSLPIYNGILSDHKNILQIKPHYQGLWKSSQFAVAVRTNSRGYREDFDFNDQDIDIAFMGDSFTFGHGVDVENRYNNVAARRYPDLTAVSLSYNNGFQPEHYEYFLDLHPDLQPRLLFVTLYLGNDFDGDIIETIIQRNDAGKITGMEIPYRQVYESTLINSTHYRYQWLESFVASSNVGKLLAMRINRSPRLRLLCKKEEAIIPNSGNRLSTELGRFDAINLRTITALSMIDKEIRSRGGELHILIIPQNFLLGDVRRPHIDPAFEGHIGKIRARGGLLQAVINLCSLHDLRCHDLSRLLKLNDYFFKDAHWNEQGHRKVGNFVADLIAREDVNPPTTNIIRNEITHEKF